VREKLSNKLPRDLNERKSGPVWTVPELFFEKKQLIPALQQLLVTSLQHVP